MLGVVHSRCFAYDNHDTGLPYSAATMNFIDVFICVDVLQNQAKYKQWHGLKQKVHLKLEDEDSLKTAC